jgi:hypothetical protein
MGADQHGIVRLLERWGASADIASAYRIDFPHDAPFARLMPEGEYFEAGPPPLDDETHERVDRVVARLKWHDERRYKIIALAYRYRRKDHQIGSKLKMSAKAAEVARKHAEAQLETWLEEKI